MRPYCGTHYRQLRRASGMTLDELAEALGTTRQRLSRWEHGRASLTPPEQNLIDVLIDKLRQEAADSKHLLKRCWDCKVKRPFEDFNRDRSRPGGRQSRCAQCSAVSSRRSRGCNQISRPAVSKVSTNVFASRNTRRDFEERAQLGPDLHIIDQHASRQRRLQDPRERHPKILELKRRARCGTLTADEVLDIYKSDPELLQLFS